MPMSINITVPKFWDLKFRITSAVFMLIFTIMLCSFVYEATNDSIENRCTQWEAVPHIVFTVYLLGISVLGLLANVRKKPYLLSLFLSMLLVVIIVFIIMFISAFVVTATGAGKGYKLGDYSPWIQKRISNWNNVKNKCLLSNGFCSNDYSGLEETQVTYLLCIEMYIIHTSPSFNCFIYFCAVLELYIRFELYSTILIFSLSMLQSSPHTPSNF